MVQENMYRATHEGVRMFHSGHQIIKPTPRRPTPAGGRIAGSTSAIKDVADGDSRKARDAVLEKTASPSFGKDFKADKYLAQILPGMSELRIYRVTIQVVPNLPLTLKQKMCFILVHGSHTKTFWYQREV